MNLTSWSRAGIAAVLGAFAPVATGAAVTPPPEVAFIPVCLLTDLGSGQVLYARQPDLRFVPASLTKVMSAYVAFEQIERGQMRPADIYTVKPDTARQWRGTGTSLFLSANESVPVDALLRGITTVSANDGAVVLAEGFAGSVPRWAQLMNAEARRIGMTNSHFNTPNGWPDNGATYVSARDLVKLADALTSRHMALYRTYFGKRSLTWNGLTQNNFDPTLGVIAGADGIKTGHTREAGYNFLGSASRNGRRLAMVVAGASSEKTRADASRALLEWGFAQWDARPLFRAGALVGSARVQGGTALTVGLEAPRAIHAALPYGTNVPIALRIVYNGPLVAPIVKGAPVAVLEIRSGTAEPGRVQLRAARSIGRAGLFDRLRNGLYGMIS
jgi:D-alanyl-D-alanine carboxypeptidase (penicillin-binding protein 5/6)